jgi:putative glycosyltransferase (TIGR04372 family)
MPLGPDKASHFINAFENHLRRSQLEGCQTAIKIVIWPQKFPNEALTKMYRRVVYIVGPRQRLIAKVLPFVIWRVTVQNHSVCDSSFSILKTNHLGNPSISFSQEELRLGFKLNSDLFGTETPEFVMIGFASANYRKAVDQKWHPNRDLITQLSDPLFFVNAIKKLRLKGIFSVRQGLLLEDIPDLERVGLVKPDIKKYPNGFVDVWLAAQSKFLVSACTGTWWFGEPFNKPSIITDVYGPLGLYGRSQTCILQLPWNILEKRFENFEWTMQNENQGWAFDRVKFKNQLLIKNSPEQIADVIDEQLARLRGEWVESNEDIELQYRFRRMVWGNDADASFLPRIGAKFLREHQHLLPD